MVTMYDEIKTSVGELLAGLPELLAGVEDDDVREAIEAGFKSMAETIEFTLEALQRSRQTEASLQARMRLLAR